MALTLHLADYAHHRWLGSELDVVWKSQARGGLVRSWPVVHKLSRRGASRVMVWPNLARGEGAALTPRGALPDGLAERLQPHDAHHNEPEAGDPRGRRGLAEHQHPDDCRADGADAGPDRVRGA